MKAAFTVMRRELSSNRISFIVTAAVVLCATTSGDSEIALSNGNYTWLLAVLSPFFFVFYDCAKLMHLGANKRDYYAGSLMAYGALALLVSAVNSVFCYAVDPLNKAQTVVNMMGLCGWTENGAAAAFLQQALFLFLVMVFLHVLLSAQPYWYGWLADGLLAAVICVFTPIEPLRRVLAGFFGIIMFNSSALLHIAVCAALSAAFAAAGIAVLKRKTL